ncbi:uncharacterized protein E0L32_007895 [Thyridium curvatum]|uniref:Enoyl reductase (ER) domain-containing protein n=1 Tax=Thyridium curvatum TaxID=1093900 RepID=A0A507AXK0_9PEZI|nr:uncharacterized protein E0L32_007895 [Thyridium curvatum]TPX11476.1 hypothetical protein E0L32_007895 [Thyridium curvatum]
MAAVAPKVPSNHKAAVYDKPGTISTKIITVDTPEPGPGEVLIKLYGEISLTFAGFQFSRMHPMIELMLMCDRTHSGVCHSDLGVMTNSWRVLPYPVPEGQVGGHEGVGRVVKMGPGVDSSGIKINDRVGVKWISSACGRCSTFQQYVLGPAAYVTPIPDGLDSAEAAPLLCAGLTAYSALLRSRARPGNWVVISGAGGGLGHLACQIASKAMGLRVIGIDQGTKGEIIMESGAEHFVDVTRFSQDDGISNHVKSLADGLGVDAVIVCTGSNHAYRQSTGFLRFSGTVVCVGVPEGALIPIAGACPSALVVQNQSIVGSAVGNQREAAEVLDFAARGILKAHVEIRKLEDLTKAFEDLGAGNLRGRIVVDLS